MQYNPLILNNAFLRLENLFSDYGINSLKKEFKNVENEFLDKSGIYWDEIKEMISYFELDGPNEPISVNKSFVSYLDSILKNEKTIVLTEYSKLILNSDFQFCMAAFRQFDSILIRCSQKISSFNQLDTTCQVFKELIKDLYNSNQNVLKQSGYYYSDDSNRYWNLYFEKTTQVKIFKLVKFSHSGLISLATFLVPNYILLESTSHFIGLFNESGFTTDTINKVKWTNKNSLNNRFDAGSIVMLLEYLVEKKIIELNWSSNKELSNIIESLFEDSSGGLIKLSESTISKNKVFQPSKFEGLTDKIWRTD
jgi:hypothetical protein